MKKSFRETSKAGAMLWLFQRISAVILFIMIIFHFTTYHFISKGVIKYAGVMSKIKSPWFNLIQFLFLISALYHGLNGVWMIIEDYFHKKFWRLLLFGSIITVGLALLFVGLLTIFKISGMG